jgi:hypothetical protein
VLCVPINRESVEPNISVSVNSKQTTDGSIDWFMVGYYLGKHGNIMDLQFVPPGWSILKEFSTCVNNNIANIIPEWVQSLPASKLHGLINGFESASKKNKMEMGIQYELENDDIGLSLQRIYCKLRIYTIVFDKSILVFTTVPPEISFDNEYMYVRIYDITETHETTTVFNIEVADDSSYVVDNVATHNCHMLYQFMIHEEQSQKYLSLMMTQRSCDTFLGLPFNICSLGMFLTIMAHRVNMKPYKIIHSIADMHIYETHVDSVKVQLQRKPFSFPYINVNCEIKNKLEDYNYEDITIKDYYSHGPIKADMVA